MPHPNPRTLTYQGRTQTIAAWSRELGIPQSTLRSRLDRLGLSVEDALSRPSDARFRPGKSRQTNAVEPAPPLVEDSRHRGVARWTQGGVRVSKVFGPWGAETTITAYRRWAAEWFAAGGRAPARHADGVSVAALILRCLDWAAATYQKHGRPTSEVAAFRVALRLLNDLYGDTAAAAFGPLQLRALQATWVEERKAVKTCNNYTNKIVRRFSLGVAEALIPAAVADALAHVAPLVPGRSGAVRSEAVQPADPVAILAAIPHLHTMPSRQRVLEAVVRLQWVTGMRPGEVLELRPADLDRSREPWLYVPPSGGKTHHRGKDRRVWLGPLARAILEPFLEDADQAEPVFRLRRRRGVGWVAVSLAYYRQRLAAACQAAGVEVITPHQLRHTRATEVQRRYEDDDAVAAAIGNSPEVSRQVYVDSPADAVARRIAEEMG